MAKINFLSKIPVSAHITPKEIEGLVDAALEQLGVKESVLLEIWFVTRPAMQRLNAENRGKDMPTDVLSFPQAHFSAEPEKFLGSIVICQSVVREKEESTLDVIKHGLLHLLGYDHEVNEQEWDEVAKKIDCTL